MSKPTLVQSIFKRPSQTYASSDVQQPKKEYHSTRQEMLRIAAQGNAQEQSQTTSRPASPSMAPPSSSTVRENKQKTMPPRSTTPSSAPSQRAKSANLPQRPLSYDDDDNSTNGESDFDVFFTPNTSPRTSMASSSTITFPSKRRPNRRSLHSNAPSDSAPRSPSGSTFQYAPSTRSPSVSSISASDIASNHTNLTNRAEYTLSSYSSISSNSLDAHSVFSDFSGISGTPVESTDGSTLFTSQSELDIARSKGLQHMTPGRAATTTTEMTTTTTIVPISAYMHAAKGTTAQAAGFGTGANPSKPPPGQQRAVGDDWAKDAKWLAPNASSTRKASPADFRSGQSSAPTSYSRPPPGPQGKPASKPAIQPNGVPQPRAFNAFAPIAPSPSPSKPTTSQSQSHSRYASSSSGSTVPPPTRKPVPTTIVSMNSPPIAARSTPDGNSRSPQLKSSTSTSTSTSTPPLSHQTSHTSSRPPATSSRSPSSPNRAPISGPSRTQPSSSSSSRSGAASGSSSSRSTTPTSSSTQPTSSHSQPAAMASHVPGHSRRNYSTTKIHPSIMMNMSALMEEDEDAPFTPRMERGIAELDLASDSIYGQKLRHTTDRGRQRGQQRFSGEDPHVMMKRRRSRSLDSMSASGSGTVSSRSPSPTARSSGTASTTAQTATTHRAPQTLSSEVHALTLSSGSLPSNGTQGYNSLVLPRAPAPSPYTSSSSGHGRTRNGLFSLNLNLTKLSLGSDGKIDLTRSGIAQTTMASVEVVRGLSGGGGIMAGTASSGGSSGLSRSGSKVKSMFGGLGRKNSTSSRGSPSGSGSSSPSRSGRRVDSLGVDGSPLGFTSYRSPPTQVPSRCVLVQVWAVGVDCVDGRLVGMRFGDGVNGSLAGAREEGIEMASNGHANANGSANHSQAEDTDTGYDTETTLKKTKNVFAALGRKLSLSKRKNSIGEKGVGVPAQSKQKQRSASIQLSGPIPLQPHSSHHSQASQQSNRNIQQRSQGVDQHTRRPSFSLKRSNTTASYASQSSNLTDATTTAASSGTPGRSRSMRRKTPKPHTPVVGFIPGRSFVGRVLECGWDVRDDVVRKGEWVVGLVDVRKCGALTEFVVVDRHRIHRVPHPRQAISATDPDAPPTPIWVSPKPKYVQQQYHQRHQTQPQAAEQDQEDPESLRTLTLEELALLPLCGLPAYRAMRTFQYAFSSTTNGSVYPRDVNDSDNSTLPPQSRRRALVLRGHDGAGAMAVQMLVRRGWRVSVHVPFSCVPANASQALADTFMRNVEDRAREWGADEVIFDDAEEGPTGSDSGDGDDGRSAAVRVIETLREEGDVFDAVLDTVGGKEVREAGERLLRSSGNSSALPTTPTPVGSKSRRTGIGQFTTLVGDVPERAIPSAADHFKANLRSLKLGLNDSAKGYTSPPLSPSLDENGPSSATLDPRGNAFHGKVGYAWVSVAHDVEWEGEDVSETLGAVLRMAMEDDIKPLVDDAAGGILGKARVVPFENTPRVFVENGPLVDGGTVVVRIAA